MDKALSLACVRRLQHADHVHILEEGKSICPTDVAVTASGTLQGSEVCGDCTRRSQHVHNAGHADTEDVRGLAGIAAGDHRAERPQAEGAGPRRRGWVCWAGGPRQKNAQGQGELADPSLPSLAEPRHEKWYGPLQTGPGLLGPRGAAKERTREQ